jgi:hypothetical protein
LPAVLEKVSNSPEKAQRFKEINAVIPLTDRRHGAKVADADTLFVSGEYVLNKWVRAKGKGELKTEENKRNFIANLYKKLKTRVHKCMTDKNYSDALEKKLDVIDKKYKKIRDVSLTTASILESRKNLNTKYKLDYKKEDRLQLIHGSKSKIEENKMALRLQRKSVGKSFVNKYTSKEEESQAIKI